MSDMELQQQRLIQRIIAAEMCKVKQEAKDDIEAIRLASEERLRHQLKEFQDRERDLHKTFKKAVDRAEAFGRRQAEKRLQHEMEALISNADKMERESAKIEKTWRKREQAWDKERFEMEVLMQRMEDRNNLDRRQMKKLLRSIKLEFRYSLSEAQAELKEQCRETVCKKIEREIRETVRQRLLKSESVKIQNVYRQFQDGTYWNMLYKQITRKQRVQNELLGVKVRDSHFCESDGETESSFIRTFGLNHVASPVLKPMLKWTASSPAPSIIENVLSPATSDAAKHQNNLEGSNQASVGTIKRTSDSHFHVYRDDKFIHGDKIDKRENSSVNSSSNRSLLWPGDQKVLHDRTNENYSADKDTLMSSLKNIKLPQNPFQTSFTNISRSYKVDIVPNDPDCLNENQGCTQYDDETTVSVHSIEDDGDLTEIENRSLSDEEETVSILRESGDGNNAAILWKLELQAHAKFRGENPELLEDIVRNSENKISTKSLGKLLKLWDVVGIPSNTRSRTLQSIHSAVTVEPEKARLIVHKMCEKLLAFIEVRKKEVLAIRKREEMKVKLADDPSLEPTFNKLSSILVRVIKRWEEANGQCFLFRGIPYIELLEIDGYR